MRQAFVRLLSSSPELIQGKKIQKTIATPRRNTASKVKKWQKMFRYVAKREKAIKEFVVFSCLIHDLSKRSIDSPDWISDGNGGKIYL